MISGPSARTSGEIPAFGGRKSACRARKLGRNPMSDVRSRMAEQLSAEEIEIARKWIDRGHPAMARFPSERVIATIDARDREIARLRETPSERTSRIAEIKARVQAATPGTWSTPHLADDSCECNCTSVLADGYSGSICIISLDNGQKIGEGGNDAPPLAEAKANGEFIAHSRSDVPFLLAEIEALEKRIADAPHEDFCTVRRTNCQCNCWKSESRTGGTE